MAMNEHELPALRLGAVAHRPLEELERLGIFVRGREGWSLREAAA